VLIDEPGVLYRGSYLYRWTVMDFAGGGVREIVFTTIASSGNLLDLISEIEVRRRTGFKRMGVGRANDFTSPSAHSTRFVTLPLSVRLKSLLLRSVLDL
jgi:hypothetical protein